VQRATGPRLLRDRPWPALDSNLRPCSRWSNALPTRLSRHPDTEASQACFRLLHDDDADADGDDDDDDIPPDIFRQLPLWHCYVDRPHAAPAVRHCQAGPMSMLTNEQTK